LVSLDSPSRKLDSPSRNKVVDSLPRHTTLRPDTWYLRAVTFLGRSRTCQMRGRNLTRARGMRIGGLRVRGTSDFGQKHAPVSRHFFRMELNDTLSS